jgi:type VI secretion system protein ImpB
MPESTQHKLDRIRPPRVQITYDVETRGSFVKMELPFVVGILADLSGNVDDPQTPRPTLRDRKYVEIDRDNFNDIMKNIAPKVDIAGNVIAFNEINDFSPIQVLKQLPANTEFKQRTHLSDMMTKLDGNVKLQKNLLAKLMDKDERAKLKTAMTDIKNLVAPAVTDDATKPREIQGEVEGEGDGGKK